jgi:hypothetical protein
MGMGNGLEVGHVQTTKFSWLQSFFIISLELGAFMDTPILHVCSDLGEEDEEDEIRNGCGQLCGLDKRCCNGKIFTQYAV